MLPAIKAEFRKLLTIRSTYFISLFSFALVIFFSFYIEGLRGADNALSPAKLQNEILGAVGTMPIFGAIVAILLVAHEYRYNTIMYTLTSINRRTKVLLAKIVALTSYTIVFVLVGAALGVLAMYVGLQIKDISLISQHVAWGELAWRIVFYSLAYTLFGFILAILFRNVVASIVTMFILPSTAEPLLGLLLKENSKYLPLTSLERVISPGVQSTPGLSAAVAAGVFSIYLIVLGIVAWLLFMRRDATN